MKIRLFACVSLALAAACSDDPAPLTPDAAQPDAAPDPDANPACPEPTAVLPNEWRPINAVAAGAVEGVDDELWYIDGTAGGPANAADNPYIYVRFGAAALEKVAITDTQSYTEDNWDIAIKRAVIRSNGGDSGPGGREVAIVDAATLEEVTELPGDAQLVVDDWVSDECEYQGGLIGEPATAVGTWYEYDPATNRPAPLDVVYVIKRPDGAAFKLEIETYYHDGLPSGNYAVRWAPL